MKGLGTDIFFTPTREVMSSLAMNLGRRVKSTEEEREKTTPGLLDYMSVPRKKT